MAVKKKANQKPTKSVIISKSNSLYEKAIELYEKSGRTAQKWQVDLMKCILSRNKKDLWTHTKFGYSLPRRNGKNEIVTMRELFALVNGEKVNHTAHRTTTSHSAWDRLLRLVVKIGFVENEDFTSLRAIGRERIEFLKTDGVVEFRTRTSTGGLGEGFDLLVIDEAQEYTDDQESALKYVVTDSKNPQTIFCGTPPTMVSKGTVFTKFRKNVLSGTVKNGGWAEWSVEEQSDVRDKKNWYLTNPSLGTIFTERSVEDEIGEDEIDFNIQRLGLWLKYNQKSDISKVVWDNLKIKKLPKFISPLFVGIKYGIDGTNVAMSIAVKTEEKKVFIECIGCKNVRFGNNWIIDFLKKTSPKEIVIDGKGRGDILAEELKKEKIKHVVLPTVKEFINANSLFDDGLYKEDIMHNDQASVARVITNVEKRPIGTNGGFGFKSQFSDMEIAIVDSLILAYWSCKNEKEIKRQKIIY